MRWPRDIPRKRCIRKNRRPWWRLARSYKPPCRCNHPPQPHMNRCPPSHPHQSWRHLGWCNPRLQADHRHHRRPCPTSSSRRNRSGSRDTHKRYLSLECRLLVVVACSDVHATHGLAGQEVTRAVVRVGARVEVACQGVGATQNSFTASIVNGRCGVVVGRALVGATRARSEFTSSVVQLGLRIVVARFLNRTTSGMQLTKSHDPSLNVASGSKLHADGLLQPNTMQLKKSQEPSLVVAQHRSCMPERMVQPLRASHEMYSQSTIFDGGLIVVVARALVRTTLTTDEVTGAVVVVRSGL